jgi:hypothetical protein
VAHVDDLGVEGGSGGDGRVAKGFRYDSHLPDGCGVVAEGVELHIAERDRGDVRPPRLGLLPGEVEADRDGAADDDRDRTRRRGGAVRVPSGVPERDAQRERERSACSRGERDDPRSDQHESRDHHANADADCGDVCRVRRRGEVLAVRRRDA